MTVREFLSHLDGVKAQGGYWMARCPSHDDHIPSLKVSEGDGGAILLKCFAGCDADAVVGAKGLTMADLFADRKEQPLQVDAGIEAVYDYRDESGELLFQVLRKSGKKFVQRRPDGNGGWTWKLEGVRRVLYRLPELLAADPAAPVFVVEGEKDVDRLLRAGVVATCNPHGAGKWRKEYGEPLRGHRVVILPDHDDPGRDHAVAVGRLLTGVASSTRILPLQGLPPSGDVSDWLDAGHDLQELLKLATQAESESESESGADDSASVFGPGFYSSLRELHAKETAPADDLMIGVRRRQVTIFASVTSVGKTTLMLNHALAAAGGQRWAPLLPGAPERPLKIIFIDAESTDDELKVDTIKMLATIGNREIACENFIPVVDATVEGEALDLTKKKHFEAVKRFIQHHQPDIVILDTITSLFTLFSENDNAEVIRKVIRPLKDLAVAGNCAIWASHHIGKAGESDDAEEAYRGRGASAFGANVRGVITLRKEKALGDGYVRLTLGKSKGGKLDPVNLKLDFARRTFELCATAPQTQTPYSQVIGVFNGQPLKRGDVKKLLTDMSASVLDRCLKEALGNGDLRKTTYGAYERPAEPLETPPKPDFVNFVTPYRDDKPDKLPLTADEQGDNPYHDDGGENWPDKLPDDGFWDDEPDVDGYGDLQNNPDWRDE